MLEKIKEVYKYNYFVFSIYKDKIIISYIKEDNIKFILKNIELLKELLDLVETRLYLDTDILESKQGNFFSILTYRLTVVFHSSKENQAIEFADNTLSMNFLRAL